MLKQRYESLIPNFEQVGQKCSVRIKSILKAQSVPFHSVLYRIKDAESFVQKVERKNYQKPFEQCTDIIGVRIVCVFTEQVASLIEILEKHFHIIEKVKKEKHIDQFSYDAYHVIIAFERSTIEIQIRTILQEAWSEMEHHVNYKKVGVDEKNQRKIHALAAMFELAEQEFSQLFADFHNGSDGDELTPIRLYHFSKTMFPWSKQDELGDYARIVEKCQKAKITSLSAILQLYEKYKSKITASEKEHIRNVRNNPAQWPTAYKRVIQTNHYYTASQILHQCLDFLNRDI